MRRRAFILAVALATVSLFGLAFAGLGTVSGAVSSLCTALTNFLPIVGMLMLVFAAVVYASGQMMGAETRARGNVWATAGIGGALMAFLIFAVAPPVLQSLYGNNVTCTGGPACGATTCPAGVECCDCVALCHSSYYTGYYCRTASNHPCTDYCGC